MVDTSYTAPAGIACIERSALSIQHLPLTIIAFFAVVPVTFGQLRAYSLSVPPIASIQSQSSPQTLEHPLVRGNLNFFDSRWNVTCNMASGATVRFAAQTFQHESDVSRQRDVQLRIQSFSAATSAGWSLTNRTDRSRHSTGKSTAMVSMASDSPGAATVNLRVRFITGSNPAERLPAGQYSTIVVGTITAN